VARWTRQIGSQNPGQPTKLTHGAFWRFVPPSLPGTLLPQPYEHHRPLIALANAECTPVDGILYESVRLFHPSNISLNHLHNLARNFTVELAQNVSQPAIFLPAQIKSSRLRAAWRRHHPECTAVLSIGWRGLQAPARL
jgi:hypothetical protein